MSRDNTSQVPQLDISDDHGITRIPQASPVHKETEKKYNSDEIEIAPADEKVTMTSGGQNLDQESPEMRQKIAAYYGQRAEEDALAPRGDITAIMDAILAMSEQEAIDILVGAIDFHRDDPNFPGDMMTKIRRLVQGYKAADMEESDWLFDLKTEAAILHYHSPYPEVRAVTDPFDDPTIPVETFRAYVLGMCFMAGATALNSFFSPRQPAIDVNSNVLQLLLAPCGVFWAKWIPKWGLTLFGKRVALNIDAPWSYKEQTFSTIMFTVAHGPGATYYVYLVLLLPQYLDQAWVSFGFEICLAICVQTLGFGFAGVLRRFVIFPVNAIWPKVLPALALNRALLVPEKKGEVINGWRLTRYKFFLLAFGAMFVYFWIPNTLFQALRSFNWMTWIAPDNFALGAVTGFYGGMGYNPWATFDWNVAGTGYLVTPFFSAVQQYFARFVSGLIIIGMYWGNYVWSAYTPINSNESFDNQGKVYNVRKIMGEDGYVNIDAYTEYGPPYFSGANVFGQGGWFAWYPLVLFYVSIRYWSRIQKGFVDMWGSIRHRRSLYEGMNDPHSRMIAKYKEVPEWWFFIVLVVAFAFGVVALEAYPTNTPWWIMLAAIAMNFVFLIPGAILMATTNVTIGIGLLFQMLAGTVFAGNPQANIIANAIAGNFNSQADNYISDLKMAHYAKLPPRAVFRAQVMATILSCFIFIGLLNWMVENFNKDGSLCTWDNPQRFVCTNAVLTYATAIMYGAFGIPNLFELYPILPYCFLLGAVTGIGWAVIQKYGPRIRERCRVTWPEQRYATFDKWFFKPLALLAWSDPATIWAGALNWTGGNNLSYATNAVYVSFTFMYYIKRHYPAWWEKYNFLLEAGFDVGVAISAIIQTLIFAFSNNQEGISIDWWGNQVQAGGVDWQLYNQNASLLPIPEVGYFGLAPEDYPYKW